MADELPAPQKNAALPERRRFLRWLAGGFFSLWGLGSVWVLASFIKNPVSRHRLTERIIEIGPLDSHPVGEAVLVRHGDRPIFVVRVSEEIFIGLSAVCTHLNCVLTWDSAEGVLRCPCHDGIFDVNGNVVAGPPPLPLARYKVEARLGDIFLHL